MTACNNADLGHSGQPPSGDPTELALLRLAADHGEDVSLPTREKQRRRLFRFDPRLKLMTTVDTQDGGLVVYTKGAPEEVLARATMIRRRTEDVPLTALDREAISGAMTDFAGRGLRVLAIARRQLPAGSPVPGRRPDAERDLCLLGW
jgi:magnesium-transporting ATPase (P-type)